MRHLCLRTLFHYRPAGTVSARSRKLSGRALGRVVAHEIYHILAKTPHDGTAGVARSGMTSANLVSETLVFDEHDLRKLHARTLPVGDYSRR